MKPIILLFIPIICINNPAIAQQTYDCEVFSAYDYLDVNSVRARLNQGGSMWWDAKGSPYYEVPKTEEKYAQKNVIFSGALWMGGLDDSKTLRVAANTYIQSGVDFWPGPLENEATNKLTCSNFDKISKLNKTEIDSFKTFGTITDQLKYYPAKNNPHLHEEYGQALPKDEDYAPFVDVNKDNMYNVDDGDYPLIKGDQSLYWIINDLGNNHTETNGNTIGVEVKNTAYAYADPTSIIDTVTFYRFDITNKSRFNYTDFVFGLHVDSDLGQFQDDYVGVDTADNFAFVYNGDTFDEGVGGYGDNIPILGIAMLRAPYIAPNNQSRLGAFVYYNGDGSDIGQPNHWGHYYSYMNAKWQNGASITFGSNGTEAGSPPTKFMFSGNPADDSENVWSECSVPNDPDDRRFVLSSKPFSLPKGATASFEYAVITSFDIEYPCPDITGFKNTVRDVQRFYDANIQNDPVSIPVLPQSQVQVFHNSKSGTVHIVSGHTFSRASLYTIQGIEISKLSLMDENTFSLNDKYAVGIYLVKLSTQDGQIFIQKLLIE